MHHHRTILVDLAILVLAAGLAHAARTDGGSVLPVNQPPFSEVLVIGVFGNGTVMIDGGTTSSEDAVALGGQNGVNGTLVVTGAGSKLTTTGDPVTRANGISVGFTGTGSVEVTAGGVIDVDGTNTIVGDPGVGIGIGVQGEGSGAVLVSGAGSTLLLRNGAAAGSGISVGYQGSGTLDVRDGGVVRVDAGAGASSGLTVAFGPQSQGTLVATGTGSSIDLIGTANGLTVGNAGTGTLKLENGATAGAQVAFVGLDGTGSGTLEVRDGAALTVTGTNPLLGTGGFLAVGLAGRGVVEVVDGSIVLENHDGLHGLQVGGTTGCNGPCQFTGGIGSVALDGPSASLRIVGARGGASIGADGVGRLTVRNGATFTIEDRVDGGMIAGNRPGSTGSMEVEGAGSVVDAGSGLLLGLDGMLADTGTATLSVTDGGMLTAPAVWIGTGSRLEGDGIVDGGVENLRGAIVPGTRTVIGGALTVHGDLEQSGGLVRLRIAGTQGGAADRLTVGGALMLLGGGVHLDLVDGYLPRAGDEIVVASAGGTITVDPAVTTSYAGAAPGLSFTLAAEGNELRFRASSDAKSHGACQTAQLRSFGAVCRKVFACQASFVKTGDASAHTTCNGAGEAAFAKSYDAARRKADRRGATCGLTAPAAESDDTVTEPGSVLAESMLTGWSPGAQRADDVLRRRLLQDTGALCGSLLDIAAGQARRRNVARALAGGRRARARFTQAARKALAKASNGGVTYTGPTADEVVAAIDALVRDASNASAGVVP